MSDTKLRHKAPVLTQVNYNPEKKEESNPLGNNGQLNTTSTVGAMHKLSNITLKQINSNTIRNTPPTPGISPISNIAPLRTVQMQAISKAEHSVEKETEQNQEESPESNVLVQKKGCISCNDDDENNKIVQTKRKDNRLPYWLQHHALNSTAKMAGFQELGLRLPLMQPKLRINAPGDKYEKEADAVADRVVAINNNIIENKSYSTTSHTDTIQKKSTKEDAKEATQNKGAKQLNTANTTSRYSPIAISSITGAGSLAQRFEINCTKEQLPQQDELEDENITDIQKSSRFLTAGNGDDTEQKIKSATGKGFPLRKNEREFFEQRMGYDLRNVRIHTSATAQTLNQSLGSYAFTSGNDIFFSPGQFDTSTRKGKHLLAHELTHVIQQTGNSQLVNNKFRQLQRKVKPDSRPAYYSKYGPLKGSQVHTKVENALLARNPALIVEAPIPGATRLHHQHEHNRVGWADLYKSGSTPKITGIVGTVENMTDLSTDIKNYKVTKRTKKGGKGKIVMGPRIPGWKPDFPREIQIADIKPASLEHHAGGMLQLDSYKQGYSNFVDKVDSLKGNTKNTPSVTTLNNLTIPAAIDYRKIATQDSREKDAIIVGRYRYWVYPIGAGLYVYMHIHKGYREASEKAWRLQRFKEVEQLAKELRERDTTVSGKFKPGVRPKPTSKVTLVQTKKVERPKSYWTNKAKQWEKKRAAWVANGLTAKDFKDKKSLAHGAALRAKWDKKLNITTKNPTQKKNRVQQVKAIRFWAGRRGKFIGKLRFKFGRAFDRVNQVWENIKEKFKAKRKGLDSTSAGGMGFGGAAGKILKLILKAAKVGLGMFIGYLLQLFSACLRGSFTKVLNDFTADIQESLTEKLNDAQDAFCKAKAKLEEELGGVVETLNTIIKVISAASTWGTIITTAITTIRVGAQAIACLSPPLLGCLWGLAAQLGIEAALSLVVGTQWFNDNVINPALKKVVSTYIEKPFYKLINKGLKAVGVPERYHCEAKPPSQNKGSGGLAGSFMAKGGISSKSALLKHRGNWENKYGSEFTKLLREKFEGSNGKPATKQELKDLAEAMDGLSPTEMKAILDKLEADKGSGKVKMTTALLEFYAENWTKQLSNLDLSLDVDGSGKQKKPAGTNGDSNVTDKDATAKSKVFVVETSEFNDIIKEQEKKSDGNVIDVISQPPPADYKGQLDTGSYNGVFSGGIPHTDLLPKTALKSKYYASGRVNIDGVQYRLTNIEIVITKVIGTEAIEGFDEYEYVKFEFYSPKDFGIRAADFYYSGGSQKKRIGKIVRKKPGVKK